MEKKFTFFTRSLLFVCLSFIFLISFTAITYSQSACPNSLNLFTDNFGEGSIPNSSPDITGYTYQATGNLTAHASYRIINNSHQNTGWHTSTDHTGNNYGKMFVANGYTETFYKHVITRSQGFPQGSYSASFYAMSLDPLGSCTAPLLTSLSIRLEYLDASNNWVPLAGSPYTAPDLAQTANPTWIQISSLFMMPSTGNFLVTSVRYFIRDATPGGCGNDFAIDDINLSLCSSGGPAPVEFLNINARQKGSGVSVDWSTSQEFNSNYFEIEKSADGNSTWSYVVTIKGAGTSSVLKAYNAYDPRPFSGVNFYRIKQVDKDGNFKYSKTVNVKINTARTGVSVLANPFHNSLQVDFLSSKDEVVNARLVDITGKQVANEKWSITAGNTRKEFSNISALQQGMYILSVYNGAGEVLYNNKVIKQ
ncbi:MAG: T9SS type A sorting domain-containing protein [Bacteroidota bacterium]|nr:T9SS type A sorting domain-containing protein [Bacteroidota bacterium]